MGTKLYVVIKDETDFNGERSCPKVFLNKNDAESYCSWERQKSEDWATTMNTNWLPSYYVEESEMDV